MLPMTHATWYFDVISPYAYLHLKQFAKIAVPLEIEYRPVLFAGLLKHWETKGAGGVAGEAAAYVSAVRVDGAGRTALHSRCRRCTRSTP
jgi:hypothetical protein